MTTKTSTEPLASGLRSTIELNSVLLPEKGTYALVSSLDETTEFAKVGRYTGITLPAGYYVYFGSAHGSGGIQSRLAHHLRDNSAKPKWHLDYIRPAMTLLEAWVAYDRRELECLWAQTARSALGALSWCRGLALPTALIAKVTSCVSPIDPPTNNSARWLKALQRS